MLAFSALTERDIQSVFDLLLTMENRMRHRRRYQPALPQYERLLLVWDVKVLAALARDELGGGFSGGFARQGAAKCREVLEQTLDVLADVQCPGEQYAYRLQAAKGGGGGVHVACEAAPPPQLAARDEL